MDIPSITTRDYNTTEQASKQALALVDLPGAFSLSADATIAPSSLVGYCITSSPVATPEHLDVPTCPDAGWLRGVCKDHGTERWVKMPCKRRGCVVCGQIRKQRIAWRIARGVELLGGDQGGGWNVLTFDQDVNKYTAVRRANQYIQWIKRYCQRHFGFVPEWVKVWEVVKGGRLHLNIIFAPWHYIPQSVLAAKWHSLGGGRVSWIERVGAEIGVEAAKSRQKIGNYIAKWDQMVIYGRGVCYSKGWPKLPKDPVAPRRGEIAWNFVGGVSREGIMHWYETELGYWREAGLDEWSSADPEVCDCFEFKANLVKRAMGKIRALMRGER